MLYSVLSFLTKKTVVEPPPAKECLLQVLNLVNGEAVSVEITGHNIFPDKIESYKVWSALTRYRSLYLSISLAVSLSLSIYQSLNYLKFILKSIFVTPTKQIIKPLLCCQDPIEYTRLPLGGDHKVLPVNVSQNRETYRCQLNVTEHTAYSLILYKENNIINCKQVSSKVSWISLGSTFDKWEHSWHLNILRRYQVPL